MNNLLGDAGGIGLYTTGITSAAAASYMAAPNMLYTQTCRTVALLAGFNLSSPNDIHNLALDWEGLKKLLIEIQEQLKKSGTSVTADQWKNMGRAEHDKANKEVIEEIDSVIKLTTSQKEALTGIAWLSLAMAIFCATTGGILLAVSFAQRAAWVTPLSGAAAGAVATAAGQTAQSTTRTAVMNNVRAWGLAALISGVISAVLRGQVGNFPKTGAGTSDAPQFEQIKIDGLAQADPSKTSGMSGMPSMPSMLG